MPSVKSDYVLFALVFLFCFAGILTLPYAKDAGDIIKLLMLFVALAAVAFGWKQLKANHDWNRRSMTILELYKIIGNLRKYRMKLDELTAEKEIIKFKDRYVSFSERYNFFRKYADDEHPLTSDEFHQWVCSKESSEKVFSNIQDRSGEKKICKTTATGELIVHYVLQIINTYEEIATGVHHRVYDEDIVLDLLEHAIVRNFEFFKPYIAHRRDKHDGKEYAKRWEELYIRILKKGEKKKEKRPPTDA